MLAEQKIKLICVMKGKNKKKPINNIKGLTQIFMV